MLHAIDAWLIDKFEQFSHWTQRCFGLASGTWTRWCLLVCAVAFVSHEIPHAWGTPAIVFDIIFLVWLLGRFCLSFECRNYRGAADAVMNPAKLSGQIVRPLMLAVALVLAPMDYLYHSLWFQFSTVAFYFEACDDLPPGKSKLKRFVEAVRRGLEGAPVPVPVR